LTGKLANHPLPFSLTAVSLAPSELLDGLAASSEFSAVRHVHRVILMDCCH